MPKILFVLLVFVACKPQQVAPEAAAVWAKIKIDFSKFDREGLAGGSSGKVAADYEFCIPQKKSLLQQVQSIDTTAKVIGGKGRVGCSNAEWLISGNTHQARFKKVLYDLASLPYVRQIQETFYE